MPLTPSKQLDHEAVAVATRLATAFNLTTTCGEKPLNPGALSIGIEIEVPWSSYFPGLWEKYGLAGRRISSLSTPELLELTRECSELETELHPRLQKVVDCGIPRGNDRYHEFAFNPVHDTSLLVEQVRLLSGAGLLPRQRKHSLQVTIGGMPRCRSLYYLAMLLEVQFVDPERIRGGMAQTESIIHTGWARKGMAGIHEKGPDDLKYGCAVASEIRMLQLPTDNLEFSKLMATVQWGANAIAEAQAGHETLAARQWSDFEAKAQKTLRINGFDDSNWSRIEAAARRHEVWRTFSEKLALMRDELAPVFKSLAPCSAASAKRGPVDSLAGGGLNLNKRGSGRKP